MPAASRMVGTMSIDVVELGADAALVLDPARPGDDERVAGAAEMRGDLLAPLERGVHRPGPADREVVVGFRAADLVDMLEDVGGVLRLTVERVISLKTPLSVPSIDAPLSPISQMTSVLSACPICCSDVENAADLIIGLRRVGGKGFHQPAATRFWSALERIPGRDLRWSRRQLRVRRNDAQSFCRAKASSRYLSQPWSNWPLNLSIHSFGT